MKDPLLSICIPTYNRINYLLENLKVLMPQVKGRQEIEVLINDNGSTDGTEEILLSFCSKYELEISIKRNPNTLYITDNFNDVVNRSKGKYIFLLGDDDIVAPNFIETLLPHIRSYQYSIIHFNRLSGDANCSNNKIHDREFKGWQETLQFEEFVFRVMSSPNFISSQIFKREIWDNGEKYFRSDRYYGYEFLAREYFGALGTKCLYLYMPLVIMRNPPRTWQKFGFIYTMIGMFNIFKDLDSHIPGIKNQWMNRIRKTHFYDFHKFLAYLGKDPELHLKYRSNILEICESKEEKYVVNFLLKHPMKGYASKLYLKALKLQRLLSRKCCIVRCVDFYN